MYERVEELPHDFMDIRDEYLNRYSGKNIVGLDIERVDAYFKDNNLDPKPYVVVTPSDLKKVNKIDKVGALRGSLSADGKEGLYSPEMGISIILRNPDLEAQNGPVYTEGLIVHEGAHSTAGITTFLRKRGTHSYHNARSGFALPQLGRSTGFLLEEGWADMHRGRYLSQHYDDGSLDPVRRAIGWTKGPEETVTLESEGVYTPLPFKYLKLAENGTVSPIQSSIAAYAMELLINANPDIYPAMYAGRTHVDGLRDFAREIDRLSPNLYPTLRRLDYTQEDFTTGLHLIIDKALSDPDSAWK